MEINTAKVFTPQPSPSEVENATEKLNMYTSPGTDQIPAKSDLSRRRNITF
jgi:hypothetical protein